MPGKDYFKVKIDRMVNKALAEKEAEFMEEHQNDSDAELLQYYKSCVGGGGSHPKKEGVHRVDSDRTALRKCRCSRTENESASL